MPHLPTEFEPAGRVPHTVLLGQLAKLSSDVLMQSVANSSKAYISVLNAQRQVIFANTALIDDFGITVEDLLGLRPGDVFSCETRGKGPDGCGTSSACSTCGAAQALRHARLGTPHESECRILRDDGEPLDLKVAATPFSLDGEDCFLFTAIDISDAKRREALERIFFHDILNTATGVRGLSTMARSGLEEDREEALLLLEQISDHLIDEIQAQRDLLAAENGELEVRVNELSSRALLREVVAVYESHQVGIGKTVGIDPESEDVVLWCDAIVLGRVLGNLVKNALEASTEGDKVIVACVSSGSNAVFSVHNPGCMPADVQAQVFRRSFTTKGPGRGLGTYGARLLTDRYLRGSIAFSTREEAGTVFSVSVPAAPPAGVPVQSVPAS